MIYPILDWFIPVGVRENSELLQRARMFLISHLFGPFLGHTITVYLYIIDPAPNYALWVLAASISLFLGFPLTVAPGFAQPNFSGVVAFGDSLTDAGNVGPNNGMSTNTQAQSGRGYAGTWAVQLAAQLGFNLTASNSGGTNFAVGGQNSLQIVDQVNNSYLSSVGGKASPTTLYLMLGGINDWWGDEPSARASANNLNNAIVSLINAGAKYIVWVNMISADTSPGLQGSGYVNFRNNVGYFLDQWATDVANLRSSYPGVTIYAIDEYRQDQLLGANAGAFDINTSVGFTQADASVRAVRSVFR